MRLWRYSGGFVILGVVFLASLSMADAQSVKLPVQTLESPQVPRPVDHTFVGTIGLDVEQADVAHKLFVVRETIPVQTAGAMTLLYPHWEAASHGPSLTVADLAGLEVQADGRALAWQRNAVDPYAFDLDVPAGTRTVEIRFEIVNADDELSPDLVVVQWQRLLLYPAGWYARNLTIAPTVTLPIGLEPVTSLAVKDESEGRSRFAPVSLETLLDAPVYAARFVRQIPISAQERATVSLDLIAPRSGDLAVAPVRIQELTRMVKQASIVFGEAPFHHYTFLARMQDDGSAGGTEHRRSSEISLPTAYFSGWEGQLNNRDILAHEFVHAWNGLYRTPADLWAATPNEAQGGSLLWVYEGQAEFWGRILAARSGLRTSDETLDKLALDAAEIANRPGRAWRSLSDDVNYPSFMLRKAVWMRR